MPYQLNMFHNYSIFFFFRWLEKNSLDALGLNLMDAIGFGRSARNPPSRFHPNPLLPLAHVTSSEKVTLIHPNGMDLTDYERKLDKHIEALYSRLAILAWEAIPEPTKSDLAIELNVPDEKLASADTYIQYRNRLRAVANNRLRPQEDFDLLEDQIKQANNSKTYLTAMKDEVQKRMIKKRPSTGEITSDEDECKCCSNCHTKIYSFIIEPVVTPISCVKYAH